jgi:hypothetical protein
VSAFAGLRFGLAHEAARVSEIRWHYRHCGRDHPDSCPFSLAQGLIDAMVEQVKYLLTSDVITTGTISA